MLFDMRMLDLEALTQRIIGCGIEVHRELGGGLLESCYQAAMAIEMKAQRLRFLQHPEVLASYKGHIVGTFRPDFIVEDLVVLELKCVERIDQVTSYQVLPPSLRGT